MSLRFSLVGATQHEAAAQQGMTLLGLCDGPECRCAIIFALTSLISVVASGGFASEKRALELAAFKPADRTAQNAAPIAATADRSVKPAYDDDTLRESTLTDYGRCPIRNRCNSATFVSKMSQLRKNSIV